MPESDGCMCLKHYKYLCVRKVSLFQLIRFFGVPKDGFGSHFERFGDTLGIIFAGLEGPGKRLEF